MRVSQLASHVLTNKLNTISYDYNFHKLVSKDGCDTYCDSLLVGDFGGIHRRFYKIWNCSRADIRVERRI